MTMAIASCLLYFDWPCCYILITTCGHYTCPPKCYRPFLSTAPLQYVTKIQFTPATIDCLNNNKTKNALHNEKVILNYIGGDPIIHGLSNEPFVNVL